MKNIPSPDESKKESDTASKYPTFHAIGDILKCVRQSFRDMLAPIVKIFKDIESIIGPHDPPSG